MQNKIKKLVETAFMENKGPSLKFNPKDIISASEIEKNN